MIRPDYSRRAPKSVAPGRSALLIVTAVAVVLFGVDYLSGGAVRATARGMSAFVWNTSARAVQGITGNGFFARNATLASENESLKSELARVRERAAAYENLREENESLRALANLAASATGVSAPVISAYHASPYGTFQIGAGKNEGVAAGDIVLSETGFVIGRVTDVADERSVVRTAFIANADIDVLIGNAAVTARGEGGGNARLTVPRGIQVEAGDTVRAPAFGSRPVGIVGKVEEITTTAEQRVYISLPVNVSLLRLVFVTPAP